MYWVISISVFRQTIRLSAKVYLPPHHPPPPTLSAFVMCVLSSDSAAGGDRRPSTTQILEYRQPTRTRRRRPHKPCDAVSLTGRCRASGLKERTFVSIGLPGPARNDRSVGVRAKRYPDRGINGRPYRRHRRVEDPVSAFTLGRARTHVSVRHGRSVRGGREGGRSSASSVTAPRPIIAVGSVKPSYGHRALFIGFETASFGDQLRAFFDRSAYSPSLN